MQYTQPIGADANAPYIDGNTATGVEGSIVPAAALEAPQREIQNLILAGGLVPNADITNQAAQAVAKLIPASPEMLIITGSGNVSKPIGVRLVIVTVVGGGHSGVWQPSPTPSVRSVPGAPGEMATAVFPVHNYQFDLVIIIGSAGYDTNSENGAWGGNTTIVGGGVINMLAYGGQGTATTESRLGNIVGYGTGGIGTPELTTSGSYGATAGLVKLTYIYT